jgi:multiple sugar transport system substrate-binding protein
MRAMQSPGLETRVTRRTLLLCAAALSCSALLAACQAQETAPGGAPVQTDRTPTPRPATPVIQTGQQLQLRWSMWAGTAAEVALWQELADDVTKAHPQIVVKLETTSFNDYWDKLQTQLASGTEADIIAMQSLRMPVFAVRKALRPLNEFISQDPDVDFDDFFPSIANGLSFRGNVYAFGYDVGPIILYYNKQRFDAARVPYPSSSEPMTWDEYLDICRSLTDEANGFYAFSSGATFDAFVPWLWSGGGDYMNPEENECTLDQPPAVNALTFYSSLFVSERVAAPITDLANPLWAIEVFYSGKIAMHANGPWQFVNIRKNANFDWDIAPLPAGPAGSITTAAGSGFGISANTKYPEEAWKALRVITSTESLSKLARAGRGYPARKSAVPAFKDPTVPPSHVDIVEKILSNEIGTARFYKTVTTWQEIAVMLQRDFPPVLLGQQTVQETITKIKPQFDELLKKHSELVKQGG